MKLLLDTHIWLWTHREPSKLTSEVHQSIADPENDLWLSPISVWELVLLLEKRRVILLEEMNSWIEKSKKELSLREAAFSWAVADELRYTMLDHQDPADRFLVATAKVYDLTLVTSDERLVRVPGLSVLANRL
ncbi:MAG: type II toxin-antitoxin system VapC family toxin [Candidatus Acidiferrum sp.]|jgi:PIN domain nuclease of toxin-antitoxin system